MARTRTPIRPSVSSTRSSEIRLAVCLLALLGCSPPPAAEKQQREVQSEPTPEKSQAKPKRAQPELPPLPEDVVATVEGHEIPRSEFDVRYEPQAAMILARRTDGKVPEPYQAVQRVAILEQLIWSKLLELEAQRSGVDFTPEALAELEAKERKDIRDWPAWLARIGQTVEVRHQANVDYLRERVLLEARVGSLAPTEDELRAAYEANKDKFVAGEEMVRASHLQLAYGPRSEGEKIQPATPDQVAAATPDERAQWEAAAKRRAEALREVALQPGVDFNELAKQVSEGPGAYRGEDMGLFPRKQMVGEYAEAAFALEPGQLSQPIRSEKGWYVIKSFGRYPAGPLPFEAVRADLVRQLEGEKFKQAHAALRAELEGRFKVDSAALYAAKAFREAREARKRGE
jgi:peptidyl-prolyl cis-trans isomerase C